MVVIHEKEPKSSLSCVNVTHLFALSGNQLNRGYHTIFSTVLLWVHMAIKRMDLRESHIRKVGKNDLRGL